MAKRKTLKIAAVQLQSDDDMNRNFRIIQDAISALPDDVDLVCFPENSVYLRIIEGTPIPSVGLKDPGFQAIAKLCKSRKIAAHLGSVALKMGKNVFNSSVWFEPNGKWSASYSKIHLFDIQLKGDKAIRESDVFSPGKGPKIKKLGDWKVGQSICFDLRFSSLFEFYAKKGVELLLVPASFLVPTGKAHWEILLRARAIETQSYLVAAAQGGRHTGKGGGQRETYGHTMIVDPWGRILADADAPNINEKSVSIFPEFKMIVAELDREAVSSVRQQIPMRRKLRS
jgi:deaminated glutathione amidase